jgi:hypothetical protein
MQIRMIHNARDRDSLLMPMDARTIDLMLQYSMQLVRCEPTMHFHVGHTRCTGNGILHDEYGTFHLEPWRDAEWVAFRDNFVRVIMRYWDHKFELTPNRPWYRARQAQTAPEAARITCSLSLGLVDAAGLTNHRYWIIKPRETSFRSFANRSLRHGLFTHRDLSLEWNTERTRIGRVRHSISYLQSTVLHEFGHTLGLDHVNGAGNDDANYGITLEQREDVMGMGDHATARAARPWIAQLRHHLIPERHNRDDAALRFTARVVSPQLITYWDNDWVPPPAAAPHAAP